MKLKKIKRRYGISVWLCVCLLVMISITPRQAHAVEPLSIAIITVVLAATGVAVAARALATDKPSIGDITMKPLTSKNELHVGDKFKLELKARIGFGAVADRLSSDESGKYFTQVKHGDRVLYTTWRVGEEGMLGQTEMEPTWEMDMTANRPGDMTLVAKIGVSGQTEGVISDHWTWVQKRESHILKIGEPYTVSMRAVLDPASNQVKLEVTVVCRTQAYTKKKTSWKGGLMTLSVNGTKYALRVPAAASASTESRMIFYPISLPYSEQGVTFKDITYEIKTVGRLKENGLEFSVNNYIQKGVHAIVTWPLS